MVRSLACLKQGAEMRLVIAFVAFCSTLPAVTLSFSLSGKYGPTLPISTYLAPNKSWSLTFYVDSNPAVSGVTPTQVEVHTLKGIDYTLNGSPITVTGAYLQMFTAQSASLGGFSFNFGSSSGDVLEFFGGPQIFSGSTTSPTIQPGSYAYALSRVLDGAISFIGVGTLNLQISIGTPPSLSITTAPQLPQATVGTFYSQSLSATGGSEPYSWSLISGALPSGCTLSNSGTIAGTPRSVGISTFTVQVMDSASGSETEAFSLSVAPLSFTDALRIAQIVEGASWKTLFAIVNLDQLPVSYAFRFWDDNGNPLHLPIVNGTDDTLSGTLAPGATAFAETPGTSPVLFQGWAEVASAGRVGVLAIFRQSTSGRDSEATVTGIQSGSRFFLPFDNTQGYVTGLAIANTNPEQALAISLLFQLDNGAQASGSLYLPPHAHKAFVLPTMFPAVAGARGTVEFTAASSDIAVLGLRFSPTNSFTSLGSFQ